jgi:ubiquinone/menaquinone biosynthesis C-methylase UbiE
MTGETIAQSERPGILVGVAQRHGERSAKRNAAFFLPHLQPGMSILDIGCGPGAITIGLAEAVAPGEVIGVDLDQDQISRAQALAADRGVANVEFRVGSIYALPFPDSSLDAAFAHTVFMHLDTPVVAAAEVLRVLKPGGVFGVSERTAEGGISANYEPILVRFNELYRAWAKQRGVDLNIGSRLRGLLNQAGFKTVEASASYGEVYGTAESTRRFSQIMLTVIRESSLARFAADSGLADAATLDEMARAWEKWGDDPTVFHAQANGEAVGWKRSTSD